MSVRSFRRFIDDEKISMEQLRDYLEDRAADDDALALAFLKAEKTLRD